MTLKGTRIHTWDEGFGVNRAFGITERYAVEGDVLIELGTLKLTAKTAIVWIEPKQSQTLQIAMVLEGVRSIGLDIAPTNTASQTTGSAAGIRSADRVLITGRILDVPGAVTLLADDLSNGRPNAGNAKDAIERAEARFAPFVRSLADSGQPSPESPAQSPTITPYTLPRPSNALRQSIEALVTETGADPNSPSEQAFDERSIRLLRGALGTLSFSSPTVRVIDDRVGGKVVLLEDGVGVQFEGEGGASRVDLSATRGVVFLGDGIQANTTDTFDASDVKGIFLEGTVTVTSTFGGASQFGQGTYSTRSSRVYLDVASKRMLMLDAVFWTYDERRGMPLYVRADAIRQLSEDEWAAQGATIANVGFAEPHFSLGADRVIISRSTDGSGTPRTKIQAEDVGIRVGETSVLSLGKYAGELRALPLREAAIESEDGDVVLRTEWDLFALLGINAEDAARASLLLDGYADRGLGLGIDWQWQTERSEGDVLAYWIHDYGEDRLSTGARIERDGETRGLVDAAFRISATDLWDIYTEIAVVSDAAFVDSFFETDAVSRREYATGIRAERRSEGIPNLLVTAEVRSSLNDFIPNEWLLQSRGYQSQKVPELGVFATGFTPKGLPLTYFGETRVGAYRLGLAENTPAEQGFDTAERASEGLGLDPSRSISAQLRDRGFSERVVSRFDTRHELSAQLSTGPINLSPFVIGRVTAYDDSFDEFNQPGGFGSDSPLEDETRLWGAVGLRASTSVNTINSAARSDVFDIDGIRHIIEPNVTAVWADSNVDQSSLPVFDEDVESLAEGGMVRVGLTNTWQTKRGRRGELFTEDWIVLDLGYVWSEDADELNQQESSIGRWFDARPELSRLGEFFEGDLTIALTNAVQLTGSMVLDVVEDTRVSRANIGIAFDHGYRSSSFFEYRTVDEPRVDTLLAGARTEITEKYSIDIFAEYDIEESNLRTLGGRIERRFPQWTVRVGVSFDDIEDTVGFSLELRPLGIGNERRRVRTRLAFDD